MSELGIDSTTSEQLSAYHDGELRGLSRWRLERRLRREPELRLELAGLARMGELVRAGQAAAPPDLWDRIEQRLPALDARRAEAAQPTRAALAWWLRPVGAAAVVAVALLAVYVGWFGSPAPQVGVVRWMDSEGRSVMVLEADAEAGVTIIWLLEDVAEGAARGGSREVA
jgi:anti-sigma factor RsiW